MTQRMEALNYANEIKQQRAQLRRDLKQLGHWPAREVVSELVRQPDAPHVARMRPSKLLVLVPSIGPERAKWTLDAASCPDLPLNLLGADERQRLAEVVEG